MLFEFELLCLGICVDYFVGDSAMSFGVVVLVFDYDGYLSWWSCWFLALFAWI